MQSTVSERSCRRLEVASIAHKMVDLGLFSVAQMTTTKSNHIQLIRSAAGSLPKQFRWKATDVRGVIIHDQS